MHWAVMVFFAVAVVVAAVLYFLLPGTARNLQEFRDSLQGKQNVTVWIALKMIKGTGTDHPGLGWIGAFGFHLEVDGAVKGRAHTRLTEALVAQWRNLANPLTPEEGEQFSQKGQARAEEIARWLRTELPGAQVHVVTPG
jgi:hypothetical protein